MPVSSRASTVASATTESERPESCGQDKQSKGNNMKSRCGDGGTSEVVYENGLDHFKATIKVSQF